MAELARQLWTLDEFLAFDDGTDMRYELIRGEIVAMTPPADSHGSLAGAICGHLFQVLKPPCRVVTEAGIVLPDRADTYYQADLAVTCAGLTGQPFLAEPKLIVEVLSPSTEATDLMRKLPDYRTIPSVSEILMVWSTAIRIEHWRREGGGWHVDDHVAGTLTLGTLPLTLDLGDLYAGLPLGADPDQAAS